jgi:acetate kinase
MDGDCARVPDDDDGLLAVALDWIEGHLGADTVTAVGHRIVHGGAVFDRPILINDGVMRQLEALTALAPLIRAGVAERLAWTGLMLDPDLNAEGAARISAKASRLKVMVIPTDEEAMIALHTLANVNGSRATS